MLATINREQVAEAILSVDVAFLALANCVTGDHPKPPDGWDPEEHYAFLERCKSLSTPEEKQSSFERAWTDMRLERERLRTLLNGGKVNLIEEVWHIREVLWHVLEVAFGGPEECPLLESEEASKAAAHWLLSQVIFKSARESMLKIATKGGEPSKVSKETIGAEERNLLLSSALSEHHTTEGGELDFSEPITVSWLARETKVSSGAVSGWFDENFGGHKKYKQACSRDYGKSVAGKLRELMGDGLSREQYANQFTGGIERIKAREQADGQSAEGVGHLRSWSSDELEA